MELSREIGIDGMKQKDRPPHDGQVTAEAVQFRVARCRVGAIRDAEHPKDPGDHPGKVKEKGHASRH